MSHNDFVEVLWALEPGEFSESNFFAKYKSLFQRNTGVFDEGVEAALASLYLQNLVRNNVLTCARGRYIKNQRSVCA